MNAGATVQGSSDPIRDGGAGTGLLAPRSPEAKPTSEEIKRAVADVYRVSLAEMCSSSRLRGLTEPRHVAMYLCREHGMSHTTVMSACDGITARIYESDAELVANVERVKARLVGGTASRDITRCARCDGRCTDYVKAPDGKVCILCLRDDNVAAHAETARLVGRLSEYQQLLDEHGCTHLVNSESGQALQWLADKLTQLKELRRGERRKRSAAQREG